MKTKTFRLNILALSLLALMLPASAADEGYPFSEVPLNMRNIISSKVKPNIMLFIDNSGSMRDYAETETTNWKAVSPICEYKIYRTNGSNSYWNRDYCEDRAGFSWYPSGSSLRFQNEKGEIRYIQTNRDICGDNQCKKGETINSRYYYKDGLPISSVTTTEDKTKAQVLKSTLKELLQDPYYTENQRWGIRYLNAQGSPFNKTISYDREMGDLSDAGHLKAIKESIDSFEVNLGTPATNMYYAISKDMREGNAIQYRCQQNYIVMLSDGAANGSVAGYGTKDKKGYWYGRYWISGYTKPEPFNTDSFISEYTYIAPDKRSVTYDNWRTNEFFQAEVYANPTVGAWLSWQDGRYGLGFISENLANNDIKTSGKDAEGGDWNDPNFFRGVQTIKTFTIAFGDDVLSNEEARGYLSNGASYFKGLGKRGYFEATTAAQLKEAFDAALRSTEGGEEGTSTVAPAIVKSDTPNTGIIASINPKNWSGEIRFLKLEKLPSGNIGSAAKKDQDDKPIVDADGKPEFDYTLPGFGTLTNNQDSAGSTRRVIASTTARAPNWLDAADIGDDWVSGEGFSGDVAKDKKQYVDWLIRNSSGTDGALSAALRDRCTLEDKTGCTPLNPERQMGDVMDGSVMLINDKIPFTKLEGNKVDGRQALLVAGANDGMVHFFKRDKDAELDDLGNPKVGSVLYKLRLNYFPGTAPRQSEADTVWARVKDLTDPKYGTNDITNPHRYLVNAGMMYVGIAPLSCKKINGEDLCEKKPGEVILSGALGQGGRGVYTLQAGGREYMADGSGTAIALSQDNQDRWLSETPMWESASKHIGAFSEESLNLGYTVGMPVHAALVNARQQDKDSGAYTDLPDWKTAHQYDALFVANGYFGKDKSPTLYIYDMLGSDLSLKLDKDGVPNTASYRRVGSNVGRLVSRLSVPVISQNGEDNTRNGLSSPEVVDISQTRAWVREPASGEFKSAENQQDGIADVAYAGDYAGNLYRFDLRNNTVSMIYQGPGVEEVEERDEEGKLTGKKYIAPRQPITAAPAAYRFPKGHPMAGKYVIIFGTGSDMYLDDLFTVNEKGEKINNTKTQSMYGIIDDLNRQVGCTDAANCQDVVTYATREAQLTQQTITQEVVADLANGEEKKTVRQLSTNPVPAWGNDEAAPANGRGWFLDFDTNPGERVVVKADLVDGAAFFTTRSYSFEDTGKVCRVESSNGTSWKMGVDAATGGNLTEKVGNFGRVNGESGGYLYSGFSLNDLQSATTFTPHKGNDSNRTLSGAFKSGWQDDDPADPCAAGGGEAGYLFTAGSKSGVSGTVVFCGIKPIGDFRRISWREIF